jgi:hypothetical protein
MFGLTRLTINQFSAERRKEEREEREEESSTAVRRRRQKEVKAQVSSENWPIEMPFLRVFSMRQDT